MIFLGGFLPGGGVGIWGILAPLGALVFADVRSGIRWFVAFVAVFLFSGFAGIALGIPNPLPEWFSSLMLALNITVGGTIVFTLLALFAKQRDDAQAALRAEHERAEALLLNILPRSIAERLKAGPGRSPTSSGRPPCSSPTWWASRRAPSACRRRRSSAARSAVQPFRHARGAVRAREDQDHRRLLHGRVGRADATSRPCDARWPMLALDMVDVDAAGRGGRRSGSRAPRRDQLRTRGGGRDRPKAVPLRPLGRRGQHREPHGVAGHAGRHPGHVRDLRADPGRVRVRARGTIAVKGKGEMETWYLVGRRTA